MAVVSVTQWKPAKRSGGPLDRRYTCTYLVVTDDPLDGPNKAILHPAIPQYGDFFQYGNDWDLLATCVSKSADVESAETKTRWVVTCEFSADPAEQASAGDEVQSPLDVPPTIQSSSFIFRRVVKKDANGKPYAASSGELFEPPEEEEVFWTRLTIGRNEAEVRWSLLDQLKGKTNEQPLFGRPPGSVRLEDATWSLAWHGKRQYFPHQYVLLIAGQEGFTKKKLDLGFYELVEDYDAQAAAGKPQPKIKRRILDKDGQPLEKESFLNGEGKLLDWAPAKPGEELTPPIEIDFEPFKKGPLHQLNLPELVKYVPPDPPRR